VAFAWHIFTSRGKEIIWHDGGTGGFRSFVGFDLKAGVGVVDLSNASTTTGVTISACTCSIPPFLWQWHRTSV
jgi:hypothetical protein